MKNLKPLREALNSYFTMEELHTMCVDIGIEYENIGGQGKKAKVRELVAYAERYGRLDEIAAYVQDERPRIQFNLSTSSQEQEGGGNGRSQQPPKQEIHIHGNVSGSSFGGGNVTTSNQGDTFNMSGDFRGANVNVKSTLTNVNQTIGTLPQASEAEKAYLQQLITKLNEALQQAPAEKAEAADAVAQYAEALVGTANSDKPNKVRMEITGDGLKKAAENLAGIVPNVVKIAGAIVTGILGLG